MNDIHILYFQSAIIYINEEQIKVNSFEEIPKFRRIIIIDECSLYMSLITLVKDNF